MGNRVSNISDSLNIKIGGDETLKRSQRQNNRIKSTKYTIITFLPQNLLEQFRRIANFYFLIMTTIAIIIDSPVSPMTSLIPLVFVIAVTATKQGYEDFLRHRADNMVNDSLVTVIRNGEEKDIKSKEILQGDLVKVVRDCDVPCDIVLLRSPDQSGRVHITTANLDGETNLKTLHTPKGLPYVEIENLHELGVIECEQPQTDLYSFNGRIDLAPGYRATNIIDQDDTTVSLGAADEHVVSLTTENLLLRGSRIKNTPWAIGCAVYTGQLTKLALNSRLTRNKMSSSEKFINKYLIFFLVLLIAIVTISYFLKRYFDMVHESHNIYLGEPVINFQVSQFLQDYFSFLILFNYLIPISLYVTIEMHKFLGSFFLEWDVELFDEELNQPCIVNTSDLNEELGQVNILFSDKTGTLTKNEMIFQQCSINGKNYHFKEGRLYDATNMTSPLRLHEFQEDVFNFFQTIAFCHTVQVAGNEDGSATGNETNAQDAQQSIDDEEVQHIFTFDEIREENGSPTNESGFVSPTSNDLNPLLVNGKQINIGSPSLRRILARPLSMELRRTFSTEVDRVDGGKGHRRTQSYSATQTSPDGPSTATVTSSSSFSRTSSVRIANSRAFYARESYTGASLIDRKESTRRRTEIVQTIENMDYQASSPDEKALVEACAYLGFCYMGDDGDVLRVKLRPYKGVKMRRPVPIHTGSQTTIIQQKRLHVLEFTSDRKRMSTVVCDKRGQIWLLTKGAESHVLPLCSNSDRTLINKTLQHIDEFAREGLRTLAVARKKLTREEFNAFHNEILIANNSLTDRKERIAECQAKLETGLELLGATAVEDALQDNVRDTLESLRMAGIKVWVLTGDKVETALNIALSCGHIPADALKYFITECTEEAQIQSHLQLLVEEMRRNPNADFSLLVDGGSLAVALKCCPERFRDVSIECRAVLCCRLSPLQKCEVVQLMKTVSGKPITAAIGDGANDVSMIQEAHVGLGIVGKEGRQAARCADYAFGNFSMLKRIMLVHGHYFAQRISMLVLYFFYKNLVFMMIQLYFQTNSMFSSQSIYDSLFLTLYNVVYTSLPILFISLTEKVYSPERLMSEPELYQKNVGNKNFSWIYFCGWMLLGVYHSVICYFFGYAVWATNAAILTTAMTVNFWCFGTFMIHNVVFLVNFKLWLYATYQSYWFIFTIWGSILAFVLTTLIYNFFDINYDGDMLWVYNTLLSSISFWILSILVIITALVPDFTMKVCYGLNYRIGSIFPKKQEKVPLAQRPISAISQNGRMSFSPPAPGRNGHSLETTYL